MKLEKACMICESNIAKYQCRRCGSLVCENDYDKQSGLCSNCCGITV